MAQEININGIPNTASEELKAAYRSRLIRYTEEFLKKSGLTEINVLISSDNKFLDSSRPNISSKFSENTNLDLSSRITQYTSRKPLFTFDQLVVNKEIKDNILNALGVLLVEQVVFDKWGLRKIEPFPRVGLNFFGPSGTGKTLAAHSIASYMELNILAVSYADVESKYHGEGPKNIQAIFAAAEKDNALLFIDEADSLLSKRLINVTQGSEQAINSMRSQLLINLEKFSGIVIFATNLIENYDKAFESRIKHIEFTLPDEICRREIWRNHLVEDLPLSNDVFVEELASEIEDVTGRDIKNAVIDAAIKAALEKKETIEKKDLIKSIKNKVKLS